MAASDGLQDVIACTSEICAIDGVSGRLSYRGYDVADLAGHVCFEDVAHLLWTGDLPSSDESAALSRALHVAYELPDGFLRWLASLPPGGAMPTLRTALSALGLYEPDAVSSDQEAERACALRLTAQVAVVAAAWWRRRQGLPYVAPRADLGHAASFLHMVTGRVPSDLHAASMDAALVLHADHELNASTFAARVTAATLAGMHAAVTSAVAALEGPKHGGASESANHTVEQIGAPERAEAWVAAALAAGRRIPGFGHRVYRNTDPRAGLLRELARGLVADSGDTRAFAVTEALQDAVFRARGLHPNVDLYSGEVYRQLGIPGELFTAVFAVARIVGWTAHVMEQYPQRLIRPRAEYVGPERRTLADARR